MHFCLPWCASWSVTLTEMKALVVFLLFAASAQGSCPGCPLEVEIPVWIWALVFFLGGKPWLRTGGPGRLGGAATSRLGRKMSEDPARGKGLFHSGKKLFPLINLIQPPPIRLLRAPCTSSHCSLSTPEARSARSERRRRSARWSSGRRNGSTSRRFSGTRQLALAIRETAQNSLW